MDSELCICDCDCIPDCSPLAIRKFKKGPFLLTEKKIIVNLYKYLERTSNCLDKTGLVEKTAKILGVSAPSVYKVIQENAMNELPSVITMKKKSPYSGWLSEVQINKIRKKVYTFYMNRVAPSTRDIFNAVNQDESLPLFKWNSFEEVLRSLKLKPLRRVGTDSILDYGKVVICRREYLTKMQQCRKENRLIYYLDELWVNTEDDISNPNRSVRVPRLILLHIGNENGFIAGAEKIFESKTKPKRDCMKEDQFESWFEDTVQKLPAKSVVVMDGAYYHSRRTDNPPDFWTPKAEVQNWLTKMGIPFKEDEFKVEMLAKVDRVQKKHRIYAVDEIAKKYNVQVLRLPPFHIELNPIEEIWEEVRGKVNGNAYVGLEDLKRLVKDTIENVPVEKWQQSVQRVKEQEGYYYDLDDVIDEVSDEFLDKTEGFEDESDDSETDSDDY